MFHMARWPIPLLVAGSVLLVVSSLAGTPTQAQESFSPAIQDSALPDAPQPSTPSAPEPSNPQQASDGTLSGTVLDSNGDVLPGAQVTLTGPSDSAIQTLETGSNGQFVFSRLPPDLYTLRVTARGMNPYTSPPIPLHAGETRIVSAVTLSVSGGSTSVTVMETRKQLSEQQAHIAEQQRIVGVIPNFYSAYDWNAPPMQAKQKFQLGLRSVFDPVSFLGVAGTAGAEQYRNIFPEYGGGLEGYGKRFGAALANHLDSTLLGRAVFPSIFHQDPRYFYKGKGSTRSRALYAISAAFVAKGDNGHWQPDYSRLLGNFSAAAISNLYYPAADRGGSLVLLNGLATTGGDALANLLREFVLKRFTSHVPKQAGQP